MLQVFHFHSDGGILVDSVTVGCSGPTAAKHPPTMTLPPPCFKVAMSLIFWNAVFYLGQKFPLFWSLDSSVQTSLFQMFCSFSMISLLNFSLTFMF